MNRKEEILFIAKNSVAIIAYLGAFVTLMFLFC